MKHPTDSSHCYQPSEFIGKSRVETIRAIHAGQRCLTPEIAAAVAGHAMDSALTPPGAAYGRGIHILFASMVPVWRCQRLAHGWLMSVITPLIAVIAAGRRGFNKLALSI